MNTEQGKEIDRLRWFGRLASEIGVRVAARLIADGARWLVRRLVDGL